MKIPRVVKHKGHTFIAKQRDIKRSIQFDNRIYFTCEVCGEKAGAVAGAPHYRDWTPKYLRTCAEVVIEQVMKS